MLNTTEYSWDCVNCQCEIHPWVSDEMDKESYKTEIKMFYICPDCNECRACGNDKNFCECEFIEVVVKGPKSILLKDKENQKHLMIQF